MKETAVVYEKNRLPRPVPVESVRWLLHREPCRKGAALGVVWNAMAVLHHSPVRRLPRVSKFRTTNGPVRKVRKQPKRNLYAAANFCLLI